MRSELKEARDAATFDVSKAQLKGTPKDRDFKTNFKPDKLSWKRADRVLKAFLRLPLTLFTGRAELASSVTDKIAGQRLLYTEYRKRNYCPEIPSKRHFNLQSLTPNCLMFVIKRRRGIFGTISLIRDSEFGLPMESLYSEEVNKLRAQGRILTEVGLLALDCNKYPKHGYSLKSLRKTLDLFTLFQGLVTHCYWNTNFTDMLIVVHPKHENLYRYIGFEPIGPIRSYDGAEGNLALPMVISRSRYEETSKVVSRFLMSGGHTLRQPGLSVGFSDAEIVSCLSEHPNLWSKCGNNTKKALLRLFPRLEQSLELLDALHCSQQTSSHKRFSAQSHRAN